MTSHERSFRRSRRRYTPRRQAPAASLEDDYALARRYRRIEMALIGHHADMGIPAAGSRRAQEALTSGRRAAAEAKTWPKRLEAIEKAAAKVFDMKQLENWLRGLEARAAEPTKSRSDYVRAIERRVFLGHEP